jgi:hypothetical protein
MPHIQTEISKEDFAKLKALSVEKSITVRKMLQDAILIYLTMSVDDKKERSINSTA